MKTTRTAAVDPRGRSPCLKMGDSIFFLLTLPPLALNDRITFSKLWMQDYCGDWCSMLIFSTHQPSLDSSILYDHGLLWLIRFLGGFYLWLLFGVVCMIYWLFISQTYDKGFEYVVFLVLVPRHDWDWVVSIILLYMRWVVSPFNGSYFEIYLWFTLF